MTSPTFLHELPIEQFLKLSQEEIEQTLKAEQLYWDHKPKTVYYAAVNGAKSKNGGLVKASSSYKFGEYAVARVGDDVIYADGTTAKIISGAGVACIVEGASLALVGSRLDNGDEIVESPETSVAINIFAGEPKPENFLDHE